jgi:hypothetical protein
MRPEGPEKPEVYLLEYYIEDFFRPRTTQMVANRCRSRRVNFGQAPIVCLRLRRDITHRQPQSAKEHFRTEPIALVDHDT